MAVFQGFPKIPRLFRDMVITEKIDGTNAAIGFSAGGEFWCQSRHRIITPEDDNHDFAAWVYDNVEALHDILGDGLHFGEWWGQGINRGYGLDYKVFSLFNAHRWGWIGNVDARLARNIPVQLEVVPVLRRYTFNTFDVSDALDELRLHGSVAAPGFMQPEGVVVYHTQGNMLFKATIEGDNAPKSITETENAYAVVRGHLLGNLADNAGSR